MAIIPNPTPPTAGGNFNNAGNAGYGQGTGYMFQAGVIQPIVSAAMTRRFPQYVLRALMELIGRNDPIDGTVWNWFEIGRTRKGGQFTAAGGAASATASNALTTNQLSAQPYWQAGMTINTDYGVTLNVDSVHNEGTYQVLTCYLQDTVNDTWVGAIGTAAATSISIGFGHVATITTGEGATLTATSETSYPDIYNNQLNHVYRIQKYSRDAMFTKSWVHEGSGYYYTTQDITVQQEFGGDEERALFLHRWSGTQDSTKGRTGNGLYITLARGNAGTNNTYTGTLQESDIQDQIDSLILTANMTGASRTEFTVLGGNDYVSGFARAMSRYAVNGALDFGTVKNAKEAGIPFAQYLYRGVIINVIDYYLLNDANTFPYLGTPTGSIGTGKVNFRKMGVWLNMGSDSTGNKLISMKHANGFRMWKTEFPGTVDANGRPAAIGSIKQDSTEYAVLSDIGLEVRYAPTHGLHYANG